MLKFYLLLQISSLFFGIPLTAEVKYDQPTSAMTRNTRAHVRFGFFKESISGEVFSSQTISSQTISSQNIPRQTIPGKLIPVETLALKTVSNQSIPGETLPWPTVSNQSTSGEILPFETVSDQSISGETLPCKTVSNQSLPGENLPSRTVSNEYISGEILPLENVSDEAILDETLSSETLSGKALSDQDLLDLVSLEQVSLDGVSLEQLSLGGVNLEQLSLGGVNLEQLSLEQVISDQIISGQPIARQTIYQHLIPGHTIPQEIIQRQTLQSQDSPRLLNANSYPYALVAGGSKGIGYAIAEALAKRKFNLVLVARNPDTLEKVKQEFENRYKIVVEILSYDLSKDESVEAVSQYCLSRKLPLRMLCNVAGIGGAKDYLQLPLDSIHYMIDLNIKSGISLVMNLLPLLEQNAPSYILNVGSMAGFAPIPQKNLYSATKAALTFFSYSLKYQVKDKNISVSCLAPGPVFTKPEIVADTKKRLGFIGKLMAVPPKRVGEIAVRQTLNGKMIIVPGTISKIFSGFIRFMPRGWAASLYDKISE